MKNQDYKWFIVNVLVLLFLTGCSIQPVQINNLNSNTKVIEDIKCDNVCQIKYYNSNNQNHWIMVEGDFGNNQKYPVVLDTGSSSAFIVDNIHVIKNKLVVNSSEISNIFVHQEICYISEFNMGNIKLFNWTSFYIKQGQFLNIPSVKNNIIVMGVPVLQKFSYIVFDNIDKKLKFSIKEDFECNELNSWSQYPLEVKVFDNNAFLFVKIPIAGEEIELQFDTGCGGGLTVTELFWEQIQKRIQLIELKEAKELYPYIGWFNCKQGLISNFKVGERTVHQAQISIYSNNNLLLNYSQGLLGTQYFNNTIFVLDFKHNLMWVKNLK